VGLLVAGDQQPLPNPLEPLVTSDADVPLTGPPSLDDLAKLKLAVRMIATVTMVAAIVNTVWIARDIVVVAREDADRIRVEC
jgi:hypothetical protein